MLSLKITCGRKFTNYASFDQRGETQGCLKSKDTFLRVAVPSYSVPIGQKKGRWEHQPKGNRLIINHKIKSDVAIRRKNV